MLCYVMLCYNCILLPHEAGNTFNNDSDDDDDDGSDDGSDDGDHV